ncbi:hypothetical protein CHUAL_013735 [Chamberlinius hualienensis]
MVGRNIFLTLIATILLQSSMQMEVNKCLHSEKLMESQQACAQKFAGSSDPEAITKAKENEETREMIEECVFSTLEIINGSEFHEDKLEKIINEVGANDEQVKDQLLALMKECVAENDKLKHKEIMECFVHGAEKICT